MAWTATGGVLHATASQNAAQYTAAAPDGARITKVLITTTAGATVDLNIDTAAILTNFVMAANSAWDIDFPSPGRKVDALDFTIDAGSAAITLFILR